MPERSLDLPGIGNARELGGLETGLGRVRRGVLLRTARLDQAGPEAVDRLCRQYRLQTVVDLRMSGEREKNPDRTVEGAENLFLPVMEMEDALAKADPAMMRMQREGRLDLLDRMQLFDLSYESGMLSDEMYKTFLLAPRGIGAWKRFFRVLSELEPGRAVLWHCTDGKDRTGCAAMLILFALGADRETVMQDYLLTNEFNRGMLAAVRSRMEPAGMPAEKMNALLFVSGGVFASYMEKAIDALNDAYGSVMGYITGALEVSEGEIAALQEKFLER